jgi:hypothetical protein
MLVSDEVGLEVSSSDEEMNRLESQLANTNVAANSKILGNR